ncbi:MAG: DUF3887 domain-containing protein [Acetatifactor sp.]|nr:DUF3887 domain-containing protein [Acetatifactor sp.]
MKKRIISGIAVLIAIFALTGCGTTTMPLADVFQQEQLEQQTLQILEWLNAEEYEQVYETFREDMKQALPVEELQTACEDTYGGAGAFVQFGNTVDNGQRIEEEDYAVVMVKAQYEEQTVTFQVGYDSEMQVVGLYMK